MGKSKSDKPKETPKLPASVYEEELLRLQTQVVQMVEWVNGRAPGVAVIFEGRDAAGKGGAIKRITEYAPSRAVRTVALPKPTERETTQWYFQRYIESQRNRVGVTATAIAWCLSPPTWCPPAPGNS